MRRRRVSARRPVAVAWRRIKDPLIALGALVVLVLGAWQKGLLPLDRLGGVPALDLMRACDIKGNINARGERIYHVPGGRWYAATRISPARGERWFCSEEEARAAGWRRAHRQRRGPGATGADSDLHPDPDVGIPTLISLMSIVLPRRPFRSARGRAAGFGSARGPSRRPPGPRGRAG